MRMQEGKITMLSTNPTKASLSYIENGGEHKISEIDLVQENIYEAYTNTSLYKALKPFFVNLKVVGLYHKKEYHIACTNQGKAKRINGRLSPSQIYSFIILLLVILNTLRYTYSFKDDNKFGPVLFNKILFIGWNVLCTTNAIACFRASHKFTCLPEFFLEWDKLHRNDNGCFNLKFCHNRAYIYSVICWLLVAFNIAAAVYAIYFTNVYDSWLSPFNKSQHFIQYWYIFQTIIIIIVTSAWVFPIGLQYIICTLLYIEFKRFNACFKKMLVENDNKMFKDFEDMRQRHQRLCKLVDHGDDFVGLYNGGVVIFTLLAICIIIFNLIWSEEVRKDTFILCVQLFWLVAVTVELGFVCIGGILINQQAHDIHGLLYDIDLKSLSAEQYQQLQMFISRVSTSQIGLTAAKMFVIDKSSTLTLIGLLISYFIIIVQFSTAMPTSVSDNLCNCTKILGNQTMHCFVNPV